MRPLLHHSSNSPPINLKPPSHSSLDRRCFTITLLPQSFQSNPPSYFLRQSLHDSSRNPRMNRRTPMELQEQPTEIEKGKIESSQWKASMSGLRLSKAQFSKPLKHALTAEFQTLYPLLQPKVKWCLNSISFHLSPRHTTSFAHIFPKPVSPDLDSIAYL